MTSVPESPPLLQLNQMVAPAHTVLLVIDMQNDFCSPGGVVAAAGREMGAIQAMIPRLALFVERARKAGLKVLSIYTARDETEVSGPMRALMQRHGLPASACKQGTWGAEIIAELRPHPADTVVRKTRYGAFHRTGLAKSLGPQTQSLIITGCA